jgi:hypothetical protein
MEPSAAFLFLGTMGKVRRKNEELGSVGQCRNRRSCREPTHPRRARAGRYSVETRSLPRSLAPTLVILPSMSLIPSAPFKADLAPDSEGLIAHCKWLLSQNCGLAVFGTNSEANSLSMEERAMLLDELVAARGKSEVRIKI